jgi:RimJ/RimL family protein N-acetyltransferase
MNIKTNRLLLRQATGSDAPEMFAYRSNPAIHRFLSAAPGSVEEIEEFIANSARELDQPGTWYQAAIVWRATKEVVGDIGIHFVDAEPQQQVEIGYTISPAFQHQGIATEAVTEVVSFLFSQLNKHRITVSIDPSNASSIRLVERLGFRKEAHFKKSLFFKGEWVDDVIYACLKEDWQIRRNA